MMWIDNSAITILRMKCTLISLFLLAVTMFLLSSIYLFIYLMILDNYVVIVT